ncbi:TM2 domain-containing protein [Aliidiomarina soli]|uniref:TM2 domain-containing protein n=1 Tax=Aliidiomarina soli TaxID=1928574 RepID=A0A432WFT2_9GAMM|nr:TM2 domain-containing protein [Aliidiomarina soli]RUO32567.1 hypothetical protein CWE14_10530 [Aliidiomarina soli]
MLTKRDVNTDEERLRNRAQRLPAIERKAFYETVRREVKDPDTYAVLNWFFICGLHHFYLQKWLRGSINLTVFVLSIVLLATGWQGLGVVMLLGVLVLELGALFRSQLIVQDYNNGIYRRNLARLGVEG